MTDRTSGSHHFAASFDADSVDDHTVYKHLTAPEINAALADRERYVVRDALERVEANARAAGRLRPPAAAPDVSDVELRRHISDRAYDLIVDLETGGRAHYESPHGYNKRPCWPGEHSGVTIGCGYDLGYNTARDFEAAWGGRLPYQDLTILAGALGLKGQAARRYMPRVSHIVIEWGVALAVFDAVDLPEEARRTYRHLPKAIALHPHCFGALVSLVFNRGASFELQGNRYREMRAIKRMVESGNVGGIPAQIRAMKRLWIGQGVDGLLIRRDKEADLFQAGLNATRVANQTEETRRRLAFPRSFAAEAGKIGGAGAGAEAGSDLGWLQSLSDDELDEVLYGGQSEGGEPGDAQPTWRQLARYDTSDVAWVRNDANHPDYVHLPPDAKGRNFRLSGADLEALIRANRFAPDVGTHNKLIFALRGCALARDADHQEDAGELLLVDVRPDHFELRCVIGIYDRAAGKLNAYKASTVCNARSVVKSYETFNAAKRKGNILLTGCYRMCVGTHVSPTGIVIPGVFRLGTGPDSDSATRHVVLRTGNDVTFGTQDLFDPCTPNDNLHPALHTDSGFSSLGCLTVKGTYTNDHSGEWKRFRAAAGLHRSQDMMGTRFDMVLLTGLDAATLDNIRLGGDEVVHDTLSCLRHGSQGPEVAKLQTALGIANPSGVFNWATTKALAAHQMSKLGWASGTYGRNMDVLLGFDILGPALVPALVG